MARRILVLLALASTLLATMATTAAARSEQRSDIPACEELLTTQDAGSALREPYAFVLRREVVGTTRSRGELLDGRVLDVRRGPLLQRVSVGLFRPSHFRNRSYRV